MPEGAEAAAAQTDGRVTALDGLRGLAILFVVQYHVLSPAPKLMLDGAPNDIDATIIRAARSGWAGVDLFFVLSGFLITGILLRAKEGPHYFRNFYARRFLRIFPVYYAFIAVSVLLLPAVRSVDGTQFVRLVQVAQGDQWWYWTYLQDIPMGMPWIREWRPMPGTYLWSLAVEEQFYVVWPAVVLLCSRRVLTAVCVATFVAAFAFRVWAVTADGHWSVWYATYFLPWARMDALAAGAFIASLAAGGSLPSWRFVVGVGAIAAAAAITLGLAQGALVPEDDWTRTIGFSLLAACFACAVATASRVPVGSPVHRWLSWPPLVAFGAYSYALYLFHWLIYAELAEAIFDAGGLPTVAGSYLPAMAALDAATLLISFCAAWLSWHLFESRVLKLKRYFPYGSVDPRANRAARGPATAIAVPNTEG